MEQYVKGFQRFHAGENVRPVTSCKFLLATIPFFFSRKNKPFSDLLSYFEKIAHMSLV